VGVDEGRCVLTSGGRSYGSYLWLLASFSSLVCCCLVSCCCLLRCCLLRSSFSFSCVFCCISISVSECKIGLLYGKGEMGRVRAFCLQSLLFLDLLELQFDHLPVQATLHLRVALVEGLADSLRASSAGDCGLGSRG
jgi:hypothetical protein